MPWQNIPLNTPLECSISCWLIQLCWSFLRAVSTWINSTQIHCRYSRVLSWCEKYWNRHKFSNKTSDQTWQAYLFLWYIHRFFEDSPIDWLMARRWPIAPVIFVIDPVVRRQQRNQWKRQIGDILADWNHQCCWHMDSIADWGSSYGILYNAVSI